jgi:RNA polymerase sigma-70 factor (ECF subfamily)
MSQEHLDHITITILNEVKNNNLEEAFKLIIAEYNQKIYWHIRRILISHEDTNDVLQNTFIKIWKALPKFKGEAKIYTWIFRIATNESITFINKKKGAMSISETPNFKEPSTTQADIKMDATEIERKLEEALSLLPEKQRIVFNLKYFEDLKYDEISSITATSVGALKASYHLAVKKIEKYLTTD